MIEVSSLESARTFWEYAEYIAVAVVIVGVIGEYWAEFRVSDERARHGWGKKAALVLILGLTFELLTLVRTNNLSEQIIARDREARIALDRRTANRSMPNQGFKSLTADVAKFRGQKVEVVTFPVNFETNSIGMAIWGALNNARWNAGKSVTWPVTPPDGRLFQGIWIHSTPDERSKEAAQALIAAFDKAGIGASWSSFTLPNESDPRVAVFVGDRPTPIADWVK